MESLIFLSKKRSGTTKVQVHTNGSTQRGFTPKEDTSIPNATTESVLITSVVGAKQERGAMMCGTQNSFAQTEVPQSGEIIIMKIRGALSGVLLEIDPDKHQYFVFGRGRNNFLCMRVLKSLCGTLMNIILCHKNFRKDTEAQGYQVNPCGICVAIKIINGNQHALVWHVGYAKASHVDSKVNDKF